VNTIVITPEAGACQRWNHQLASWRRVSEGGFDQRRYDVEPITEDVARSYILTHHYSGSYPAAKQRYGLFEAGELVGVAVLSVPARAAVLTTVFPDLEPYVESVELGRLVLEDRVPANAESWMLAQVFRQAAEKGIRGVVSFSDPVARTTLDGTAVFPGHLGIIYQSSNARFLGRSKARRLTLLPNATVFSDRARTKILSQTRGHEYAERQLVALGAAPMQPGEDPAAWLKRALVEANTRVLPHSGNLRYGFALGNRSERRTLSWPVQTASYPKRDALVA